MADEQKDERKTNHETIAFRKQLSIPMYPRPTDSLDRTAPHTLRLVAAVNEQYIDIALRNYMVIGRQDGEADQHLDVDLNPLGGLEFGVSRYHAIVQIEEDQVFIRDFNSRNGTFVNGFSLKPMVAYRLREGDELVLGELTLTVKFFADAVNAEGSDAGEDAQ
jgi:hypothetical protein